MSNAEIYTHRGIYDLYLINYGLNTCLLICMYVYVLATAHVLCVCVYFAKSLVWFMVFGFGEMEISFTRLIGCISLIQLDISALAKHYTSVEWK